MFQLLKKDDWTLWRSLVLRYSKARKCSYHYPPFCYIHFLSSFLRFRGSDEFRNSLDDQPNLAQTVWKWKNVNLVKKNPSPFPSSRLFHSLVARLHVPSTREEEARARRNVKNMVGREFGCVNFVANSVKPVTDMARSRRSARVQRAKILHVIYTKKSLAGGAVVRDSRQHV